MAVVAGILAWMIAAMGAAIGIRLLRINARMRRWTAVTGEVIHREVSLSQRAPTIQTRFRYEAIVRYTYAVEGKRYTGTKIHPYGFTVGSKARMKKVLDGIPDAVTVFYHPERPEEAYLAPAPAWWIVAILSASAFAFLFGLVHFATA